MIRNYETKVFKIIIFIILIFSNNIIFTAKYNCLELNNNVERLNCNEVKYKLNKYSTEVISDKIIKDIILERTVTLENKFNSKKHINFGGILLVEDIVVVYDYKRLYFYDYNTLELLKTLNLKNNIVNHINSVFKMKNKLVILREYDLNIYSFSSLKREQKIKLDLEYKYSKREKFGFTYLWFISKELYYPYITTSGFTQNDNLYFIKNEREYEEQFNHDYLYKLNICNDNYSKFKIGELFSNIIIKNFKPSYEKDYPDPKIILFNGYFIYFDKYSLSVYKIDELEKLDKSNFNGNLKPIYCFQSWNNKFIENEIRYFNNVILYQKKNKLLICLEAITSKGKLFLIIDFKKKNENIVLTLDKYFNTDIIINNDNLIFRDFSKNMNNLVLKKIDGNKIWEKEIKRYFNIIGIYNNIIIISDDESIYLINSINGEILKKTDYSADKTEKSYLLNYLLLEDYLYIISYNHYKKLRRHKLYKFKLIFKE